MTKLVSNNPNSLFGSYVNPKFTDIWNSADAFYTDYTECGIEKTISEETARNLFYLLYARYGNNIVASTDSNRFKYMVFSLVFQYGPTWERRLQIQKELREMNMDELSAGNVDIFNIALNPSKSPATSSFEPLPYTNEQHASGRKRSKVDSYALLMTLLEADVTGEFLDRFRKLFVSIASPQTPLYYESSSADVIV